MSCKTAIIISHAMYDRYLELQSKEFLKRFRDFSSFEQPHASFSALFTFDVAKAEKTQQMDVFEMQSDSSLRAKYFEVGIPDFFLIIIIIIMVIFKCYFSGEHIAVSINKNHNGVNIALGKTNRLKALCMMQINT